MEETIPAEQVKAGDIVVIRPGESIPVDGEVTQGQGYVDQAAITGESIPVEKGPGDPVLSATINKNGSFQFGPPRWGTTPLWPDHPAGGRGGEQQGPHRPAGGQDQRGIRAGGHGHRPGDHYRVAFAGLWV